MTVPPHVVTRAEQKQRRRQEALAFAEMIRDGHTQQQIADSLGCTRQNVSRILTRACPDFAGPAGSEAAKPNRPYWSYPDEELLSVARAARREIEAAAAAQATGPGRQSPI